MLSTAGCPVQSGLSSESADSEETIYPQSRRLKPSWDQLTQSRCNSATEAFYLYVNELFIAELTLELVVLSVDLLHSLDKARSNVFAAFVALH